MSCKRKISQVQKHPGKGGMFFCPLPGCLRFLPGFTGKISGTSPKIPGFSIFRVVCRRSTGIILKGACAQADNEMHDRKKHSK